MPSSSAPGPHPPPAGTLTRTEVQRAGSSAGRAIVQLLIEIPPGVESGWHTHPGEEVGYILAGTVEILVDGEPARTLRAGDGFLAPTGRRHNARNLGADTGRLLSTYLVEADQPLATVTGPPPGPG